MIIAPLSHFATILLFFPCVMFSLQQCAFTTGIGIPTFSSHEVFTNLCEMPPVLFGLYAFSPLVKCLCYVCEFVCPAHFPAQFKASEWHVDDVSNAVVLE